MERVYRGAIKASIKNILYMQTQNHGVHPVDIVDFKIPMEDS